MDITTKLPIGIDDFKKIREQDFYYIDKTGLIKELLNNWGEVNLFTRPRRFGKSINMSMLKAFFEYGCETSLFTGLEIAGEKELCEKYMGKFPVVSISLKGVSGNNIQDALGMMRSIIGNEALRFQFLLDSDVLTETDKKQYQGLINIENGRFLMADEVLINSLWTLTSLLHKHFRSKVIVLIDEYDVPLDKAQQYNYYEQMIVFLRNLFGQVLKSNDNLYFAVLTGCLRISKESVFTGLNNLKVLSITNVQFDEYFGFTDEEVVRLLENFGIGDKYELVKSWYDGYRFGKNDVYCPWDVLSFVEAARADSEAEPQAFWINTSENSILRTFLRNTSLGTMREIEKLINGESVSKKISLELTYKELYDDVDNIWSVLFTTGYLTQVGRAVNNIFQLKIPNLEVKQIFVEQIQEWFEEKVKKEPSKLDAFCEAIQKADTEAVEAQLNAYLSQTIGIHDYSTRQDLKENYYHGLLVGLLKHREDWTISSNAEAGEGYSDILVEINGQEIGIVIEVKCPTDGDLVKRCQQALQQIEAKQYVVKLQNDGMSSVIRYGISFYKKHCKVIVAE